ncbi:uncharacterized protein BP01DRAFT_359484 [Aspergillus saccharolyticus JOP 1030-1]|uniref:Uncharacterized protein n=1 Tax=Aspergillus saccharolyticus JOP 1030-1 TaxID=1450539 RepID=A0A319A4P6_9EURO|nr:hypothetical protein BP01DRAFT_359484 [Aspergillus saccharolyticus JOP 1030-1]PYH42402.1 hypothetical protein BP01DRAFT_359484 [Aspergillus saccharolyticus JOP 1030-1]
MDCSLLSSEMTNPIQQQLINYMLLSSNVYIIQNGHSLDDCAGARGVQLDLTGTTYCYTLEKPGGGSLDFDLTDSLSADFGEVLYDTYSINQTALVVSSYQCQTNNNAYGATYVPSDTIIPGSGYSVDNLPPCFFNLPVLYTDYTVKTTGEYVTTSGTPCQLRENTEDDGIGNYLPDNLASIFTRKFCIDKIGH